MAMFMSSLRRKRGFIFKVLVFIPVLWFSFIGFVVVMSSSDDSHRDSHARLNVVNRGIDVIQENLVRTTQPHLGPNPPFQGADQPVIEQPNPDRLRLEEKMKQAAADALRRKELEQHEQHEHGGDKEAGPGQFLANRPKGTPPPVDNHDPDPNDPDDLGWPPKYNNNPNDPGEMGRAVLVDKEKLSPEERKKFDDGWQHNAFNDYASKQISIHRMLPDVRDKECRTIDYPANMPDTSVVVIFHNEAWSVLLRTLHSVIDRTPPHLLREVILVDDKSDLDHLQQQLQDYVDRHKKVKLVRAKKREGLIRARLLGASVAQGDTITFLDSHCEATQGWAEPLLARIGEGWEHVVAPVIDVVSDDDLHYQGSHNVDAIQVGGFDWALTYTWHPVPSRDKNKGTGKDRVAPIRSPTMAGGLFAISRAYFEHIGSYDPGMDIWGGENLEMSFRIWMCGGTLEIVPCSHVGHIFRKRSPYSWKSGVNVVRKNSVRLAEVWMDEYKNYYYERFNYDLGDYGDITARKELRKNLNCKSFDWFVKNIYPELFIPGEAIASGDIKNSKQAMCLDSSVDRNAMNKPIKMWPCHNQGGNQYWMLSKDGEIRRDEGCMDYAGQFVMIYPCHGMKGNQEWVYGTDNTLRHRNTNLCMELSADGQKIEMKPCTGIDRQIWLFKRRSPDSKVKNMAAIKLLR